MDFFSDLAWVVSVVLLGGLLSVWVHSGVRGR